MSATLPFILGSVQRRAGLITVVLIVGLWVAGLVAAPLPGSSDDGLRPLLAAGMYAAGAMVCHQRPDRSFHLAGAQLPVCARCLGLYVGGLLGAIAWVIAAGPGTTRSDRVQRVLQPTVLRWVVAWAALPTVVTVITASLGWWDPANAPRALLAVPLGIAIGGVVCAVASRDLR